jgi:hypothetical protein
MYQLLLIPTLLDLIRVCARIPPLHMASHLAFLTRTMTKTILSATQCHPGFSGLICLAACTMKQPWLCTNESLVR